MIDVCLLLEGTYPYVSGGVSTWVHQLITSMPEIRFGIVYIAPYSDPTRKFKYAVPNHVIYLKEIFLHEYDLSAQRKRKPTKKDYELVNEFYLGLTQRDYSHFDSFIRMFHGDKKCFDLPSFFEAKPIWDYLTDFYDQFAEEVSFLDFFWTFRGTHLPILQAIKNDIPFAKVYHAVSTGYAGLMGSIARVMNGQHFILTEHGIYTHERMLEISQSNWIYEQEKQGYRADKDLSFFKTLWLSMFRVFSHITYQTADQILTLYEGNKLRQILEGADGNKIRIIPNGINLRTFDTLQRQKNKDPQVGLIGRVVSIKDIKTFISAAKIVLQTLPDTKFYVIGPMDEEDDYVDECKRLVDSYGLQDVIIFTGHVNADEVYQMLDLVVLTSLSEAQPYVILEAHAVGIPVVATDVGACREMLYGTHSVDKALGHSGIITEVANPAQTAEAICLLIKDRDLYQKMSEAGKKRVRQFYDQDDLLSRYLNIYEKYL